MVLAPQKNNPAKIIVVLSMHRSGSSVVARGLKVLGADLGADLLPSNQDNKMGFWEDTDIHLLNMDILAAINKDWYHVSGLTKKDMDLLREEGFMARAIELLHHKMADKKLFGLKNPRMTKLLPFWKEVFNQCQYEVNYVISIRNPMSVANSLFKRDKIYPVHSYHMWLTHIIESLRESISRSFVIVDYDLLMASPERELNRIATFLNLSIDVDELEKYQSEFLNSNYRHSVYNLDTMDSDCPEIVHIIYKKLHEIASGGSKLSGSELADIVSSWDTRFMELQPTMELIDQLLMKTRSGKNSYPIKRSMFRNLRTLSGMRVLVGAARRRMRLLVNMLGLSIK